MRVDPRCCVSSGATSQWYSSGAPLSWEAAISSTQTISAQPVDGAEFRIDGGDLPVRLGATEDLEVGLGNLPYINFGGCEELQLVRVRPLSRETGLGDGNCE
jgi:hypothetical protein